MSTIASDRPACRQRWLFLIALAGLFLWALWWLNWYEPEHDEVEHWHVAWLMHQGERPFTDFFEHHAPLLWNVIRIGYGIAGESFAIIPLTRALMILVFLLTLWFAYRIARRWMEPGGTWIAVLGFPLFSYGLLLAHLFVRGDPFILLFLMIALWLAVDLAEKDRWAAVEMRRFVLLSICLGVAVGFSPRGGIPALALYVTLFILSLRALRFRRAVPLFITGGVVVLIPTVLQAWIYGFEQYLFWVYRYSSSLYPPILPTYNIIRILQAAFPLWILALLGFYYVIRTGELRKRRAIWLVVSMVVVNLFGLWFTTQPFMQHYLMTIPFFGFIAGMGYDGLMRRMRGRFKIATWNWAGILLLLGLAALYGKTVRNVQVYGLISPRTWVERAEDILDLAGDDATFAAGMAYWQPVFMKDAFYYWFPGRYAMTTMRRLQADFQPHTFEDLRDAAPTVVHESWAEAWRFNGSADYWEWLEENYKRTEYRGYWVRK